MTLVDPATLKRELRIRHDYEDEDLERYAEMASALVVDFLKAEERVADGSPTATWDDGDIPLSVQAMVLRLGVHLDRHRGDSDAGDPFDAIRPMAEMWRDPTIA